MWVHNLNMRLDLCGAHRLVPAPAEQFVIVRREQATSSHSRWQVAQIVFSIALPPLFDCDVRPPLNCVQRFDEIARVLTRAWNTYRAVSGAFPAGFS